MPRLTPSLFACLALLGLTLPSAAKVDYNEDVRPILSENCFYCHGPDGNKRKAKLRLDVRADALAHKAFVPGNPEASDLIQRLSSTDSDEVMPPPDSHRTITPAQKEILKRWIAEGAEYKEHWAYVTPVRPALPANGEKNPVDAFIVEKLAKVGLTLSSEAPKATLLRRLSLDLRRAHGPPLARRLTLCGQQRLPTGRRYLPVDLARLAREEPQRRQAVRPAQHRDARGRPAPGRDPRPEDRHGLQP
jgi:hypothetical protein